MKRPALCVSALALLLLLSGCGGMNTVSGTVREVYSQPGLGPVAVLVQTSGGAEQCFLWTDETSMPPGSCLTEGQFIRLRYRAAPRDWTAPDGRRFSACNVYRVTVAQAS